MNHISYQLALAHRDELLRQAAYSRLAKHAAQAEPSSRESARREPLKPRRQPAPRLGSGLSQLGHTWRSSC